ncbi:hypothetical protein HBI56_060530 [Parastagonospora nodorum]|nr:hypothetical protein HBH52_171850 [Parastagonospora nodorum]KAH4036231.1 hypothetical protein HBI09_084360 [Parastagonospora nodorum]KAH4106071.1 hypothetical protein HBH46_076410 [Parastagonospora nodorum]KAH4118958.1 hypothetical protein HBH47_132470 [Parastagonospora nodorum]KAH4164041.1 hypothetical protein HBH43_150120 [Parastagonospora nodorum]
MDAFRCQCTCYCSLGCEYYCAQLLIAPTRSEVDHAHGKHTWLDMGIQSTRNLLKVKPKCRNLWILLMLSSGLLHLSWVAVVRFFTLMPRLTTAVVKIP